MLTYSTSRWSQHYFFQYLSTTFNVPLLYNIAFNSYAVIEARISETCNAIHDSWYKNCIQAASIYEILLYQFQSQWNRGVSKSIQTLTNKALIEEQEIVIHEYINRLDKINMYTCSQIIVRATNYFICFENCTVVHQWLKWFLEQNPNYHIQKQKPLVAE